MEISRHGVFPAIEIHMLVNSEVEPRAGDPALPKQTTDRARPAFNVSVASSTHTNTFSSLLKKLEILAVHAQLSKSCWNSKDRALSGI